MTTKTHKIDSGKALDIVKQLDAAKTDYRDQVGKLMEQANVLKKANKQLSSNLLKELSAELGIKDEDISGLDLTYLNEHGVAYLTEGEDDCGCGLSLGALLEKVVTEATEH